MGQHVKLLRRSWFDTAQFSVVVAAGGVTVVATVAVLLGASWPWAAAAGLVVAGASAVLRQVVGPIRDRRRGRDEAERRVLDVLQGRPVPIETADQWVFMSDDAGRYRDGTEGRAPYVERDIDKVLRPVIGALARSGGLVVVQGDPKSGKSRTLWAALVDQAGSRVVYGLRAPHTGEHTISPVTTFVKEGVAVDGARSIIWIDDAHEHFGRGLTDEVLVKDLLGRWPDVIVAMTVHTHRLRIVEKEPGSPVLEDPNLIKHLSDVSDPYRLEVGWKDTELARARLAYPGLENEIANPEDFKTLARSFAGVPYLQQRYRREGGEGNWFTNPRGIAVAKAAIDWRRAGMPAGLNDEQLLELATIELDEVNEQVNQHERFADVESFRAALDWANGEEDTKAGRYRWKGVALVRPVAGTDPILWQDFDAVTATIDDPLSERCWDFVAQHLTADTGTAVGVRALYAGMPSIAEAAFRTSAENDMVAMSALGFLLATRGGDENEAEAKRLWQQAAKHGFANAMFNLGNLLQARGGDENVAEAERWYREAAKRFHTSAMSNLGTMLWNRGGDKNRSEGTEWIRRAAGLGSAPAMANLGLLLANQGGDENLAHAEDLLRLSADLGYAPAMSDLRRLLRARGGDKYVAEADGQASPSRSDVDGGVSGNA
jgi:hypothetical protein